MLTAFYSGPFKTRGPIHSGLSSPRSLVIREENKRRTKRAFSRSCRKSLLMNYHNYAISDARCLYYHTVYMTRISGAFYRSPLVVAFY